MVRIFGHKPSEIRKATAGFAAAGLALLVALPVVGLPAWLTVLIASLVSFLTGVTVYLSKPNVKAIIDAADDVDFDIPGDLFHGSG